MKAGFEILILRFQASNMDASRLAKIRISKYHGYILVALSNYYDYI